MQLVDRVNQAIDDATASPRYRKYDTPGIRKWHAMLVPVSNIAFAATYFIAICMLFNQQPAVFVMLVLLGVILAGMPGACLEYHFPPNKVVLRSIWEAVEAWNDDHKSDYKAEYREPANSTTEDNAVSAQLCPAKLEITIVREQETIETIKSYY